MLKQTKILEVSVIFSPVLFLSGSPSPRDDSVQLDWGTDLMGLRVRPEEDMAMASYRRRGMAVKLLKLPQRGQGARPGAG